MNDNRIGSYVGNGAAQDIELGFVPGYLVLINATDGTNMTFWFNGMAAGAGIAIVAAAGPVLDAAGQITAYNGTAAGKAPGFTVGTDLSVAGKTYRYFAARAEGPFSQPATAGAQTGASA